MVYHPTIHWPPPLSPLHYRLNEGWVLLLLMKLALPRYQSSRKSTHHLQAISLILFTVLETFVFLIAELYVHKITGSRIGGSYNQPNQVPKIPHGMPTSFVS